MCFLAENHLNQITHLNIGEYDGDHRSGQACWGPVIKIDRLGDLGKIKLSIEEQRNHYWNININL